MGEFDVGGVSGLDGMEPALVEVGVLGDAERFDVGGVGGIDVALAELGEAHVAVANEFVAEATGDTGNEEAEDGVFQDGAMFGLEDVREVLFVAARARFGVAHVAEASGRFDEEFGGNRGIALPADAVVVEKLLQLAGRNLLLADKINSRFCQNSHEIFPCGVGCR